MIVSAAVVFAIVGGALAFKSPNVKAFKCANDGTGTLRCLFDINNKNVQSGTQNIIPVGILGAPGLLNQLCGDGTAKPCNQINVGYNIEPGQ